LLTTLIYAGGGALALFHVGVEQHWWPGPASCAAAPAGDSYEAFRANILTQPVVRCDAPAATFLGLSLAAYNALASAALAVFAFWAWRRPRWGTQVREISA
jgi:disulfide bond formation protein DsbB